jgi:hypothetical protein
MRVYISLVRNGVLSYVLAHDHNGVDFSKSLAHNANLLGGDVVDINENALGELVSASLDVAPDSILTALLVLFQWHFTI